MPAANTQVESLIPEQDPRLDAVLGAMDAVKEEVAELGVKGLVRTSGIFWGRVDHATEAFERRCQELGDLPPECMADKEALHARLDSLRQSLADATEMFGYAEEARTGHVVNLLNPASRALGFTPILDLNTPTNIPPLTEVPQILEAASTEIHGVARFMKAYAGSREDLMRLAIIDLRRSGSGLDTTHPTYALARINFVVRVAEDVIQDRSEAGYYVDKYGGAAQDAAVRLAEAAHKI